MHINEIARELGVRYVVEGSVRRSGDQVRISAQLNDVSTGSHLWAERYDRSIADVFAVQDEITEAIVAAIEPHLYAAENFRAQHKPPGSLDAWDLVMRALSHYWRVTRQDNTVGAGAAGKGDRHRSRITARRWACSPPATSSAPIWAGPTWPATVPVAERASACRGRGRQRGRLGPSRARLFLSVRAPLRRRDRGVRAGAAAQSEFRVLAGLLCGDAVLRRPLQEGDVAIRRALRLSPRDPLAAIYYGLAAYIQFVGATITTKPSSWRGSRCGSAPISSARIAC